MFDPETNENNDEEFQDAQEHNEEEEEINNTQLSDFDYLKGIMQNEYGNNEFSNSARINEEGEYDFNISRDDPDYKLYKRRVNYILLSRILRQLEGANLPIPSYDVLNGSGLIREIKPRLSLKTGSFNRFSYRKGLMGPFKKIIVREKGKDGILRYTGDRTLQDTVMDFRNRLADARALYEKLADGIIDTEMRWDGYLEGLQIDNNAVEGQVKGKKERQN